MATETISELIRALDGDKLVLFVGHDFEARHSGLPTLADLTDRLNERGAWAACRFCRSAGACQRPGDCELRFPTAASRYVQMQQGNRHLLLEFMVDALADPQPSPLLEALVRLPVRTILTTAYDERLEIALRAAGQTAQSIALDEQITARGDAAVEVLHLYGKINPSRSLLLTEEDHLTAQLREGHSGLNLRVRGLLPSYLLLCLAVDFSEGYVRRLYLENKEGVKPWYQPEADRLKNEWSGIRSISLPFSADEIIAELGKNAKPRRAKLRPPPAPERPYMFLDAFQAKDRAIFYGREEDSRQVVERVMAGRLTILIAKSGQGKSSLLGAGVRPALEAEGFQIANIRLESDPLAALNSGLAALGFSPGRASNRANRKRAGQTLIIIDQAEELFTVTKDARTRREFADALTALREMQPGPRVLLSLRIEYQGQLEALLGGPEVMANRFTLGPLKPEDARLAIEGPARQKQFDFFIEPTLTEAILRYLEPVEYDPVQLQIICHELYQDMQKTAAQGLLLQRYGELGGAEAIMSTFMDRVMEQLGDSGQRERARTILKSLVTVNRTKVARLPEEIARLTAYAGLLLPEVVELLRALQDRRLIRPLNSGRYELAHDILALKVFNWMDEADLKRLNAAAALQVTMDRYRELGHLMEVENQIAVHQAAAALDLSADEVAMLLLSAIAANRRDLAGYWLEAGRKVSSELCDALHTAAERHPQRLGEYVTRAEVLAGCPRGWHGATPLHTEIFENLDRGFSLNELKVLAFLSDYDLEQIDAPRKDEFIRNLIRAAEKATALDLLIARIIEANPAWSLVRFTLPPPAPTERRKLHDYLVGYWSLDESQELIVFLNLDAELDGQRTTRSNQAMHLIASLEKRYWPEALWIAIAHFRPEDVADRATRLAAALDRRFDEDQLRDLCFDLGIDAEAYGFGKGAIIGSLILDYVAQKEAARDLPAAVFFPDSVGRSRFETRLRRLLTRRLREDDFLELCFNLEIRPENLPGETTKAKIRELLAYLARRGAGLGRLLFALGQARPDLKEELWGETLTQIEQRKTELEVFRAALGEQETIGVSESQSTFEESRAALRGWLTAIQSQSLVMLGEHYSEAAMQEDCRQAGIDCSGLPEGDFDERLVAFLSTLPDRQLLPIIVRRTPPDSKVRQEIEIGLHNTGKTMFYDLLDAHWNDEELIDLCLRLFVDYENLSPPFYRRLRELIDFMASRGRLLELLNEMINQRPVLVGG